MKAVSLLGLRMYTSTDLKSVPLLGLAYLNIADTRLHTGIIITVLPQTALLPDVLPHIKLMIWCKQLAQCLVWGSQLFNSSFCYLIPYF